MNLQLFAISIVLALSAVAPLRAEVKPNSLFSDNAILQRDQGIPVWGTAGEGEEISVDFAGQHESTVAKDGKWRVQLKAMPANSTPQTMTIRGENTIAIKNILVGDVWVASGQSNMERQLGLRVGQKPIKNWEAEVAAANYPEIREYYVPEQLAYSPKAEAGGNWQVCSPQTVGDFSAVGYFFAAISIWRRRCRSECCSPPGAARWRKPGPAAKHSNRCQISRPIWSKCSKWRKTRTRWLRDLRSNWNAGMRRTIRLVRTGRPPTSRRQIGERSNCLVLGNRPAYRTTTAWYGSARRLNFLLSGLDRGQSCTSAQ